MQSAMKSVSLRDPYAEGYTSFLSGLDESANPYRRQGNEDAAASWDDGWQLAEAEEVEDHDD